METHIATKKEHRCDECGRKIPLGARYFSIEYGNKREHTNCLNYSDQPILNEFFNQNRAEHSKVKK